MADTKYYFFSGKGGVGKTSMAASSAVYFANQGKRTLIVTTDPAANLGDVFEQEIGHRVTAIEQVPNLDAMEIDVESATAEYKERTLAPMRAVFPEEIVAVMEEELNSPCTEEMAAFDKFVDFMDSGQYQVVIFDTAPTGHTIRLLELPVDWSKHIEISEQGSGQTCLGPVQVLKESKAKFDKAVSVLQDPDQTTFIFVVQPESTPIAETKRSVHELNNIGIKSSMLVVNGILPPEKCENHFFKRRSEMQQRYIKEIDDNLDLPTRKMYLLDTEIKGVAFLKLIGRSLWEQTPAVQQSDISPEVNTQSNWENLNIVDQPNPNVNRELFPVEGKTRSIFFAGKGGVGKTSMSCVTAVWLAKQGFSTLLVTTDPASHLSQVFEQQVEH
ncbi:MAG: ArsA family ATPase, partial [Bacillota bacterium]|nr:ArsA family ATPase [Bacillota bacterium]